MPASFWAAYAERLAIVAVLLAALYVAAHALRRMRLFTRADRWLSVVDSTILSQHAAVHVVRVGTRHFLIGSTSGSVTRLAELGSPFDGACPEGSRKAQGDTGLRRS